MDGVAQVAVSLTHEQALADNDSDVVAPERILPTLRDLGYELYDPRKLRPFEEEEVSWASRWAVASASPPSPRTSSSSATTWASCWPRGTSAAALAAG